MTKDWLRDYVYDSNEEEDYCEELYEQASLENRTKRILVKQNKEKKKEFKNKKK